MKPVVALLAAAALAGCAGAQPRAYSAAETGADVVAVDAGTCFRMSQIRNHKVADAKTLYVDVGGRSVYRWEMTGRCLQGAAFDDPLLMTPAAGMDVICKPIDLDLKVAHTAGTGATPCIIKSFTRLTPAEVAALPPKLKP